MKPFFEVKAAELQFCDTLEDAIALGFDRNDKAFIWGMKHDHEIVKYCEEKDIHISRVEDGFIRSVSLGSDLTRPYSLVVDGRGIYINPSKESDLEQILSTFEFDDAIRERAKKLIEKIISSKFSKYNGFAHKKLSLSVQPQQKVILIPAQVEDDASMIYGGMGMDTLELIKEVREKNPSAYILFKPHPDVLSGNRKGLKDKEMILEYCDDIVEDASIDSCIEVCNEVHTITSTAGFDALIRSKEVFVYGIPFYAGWGLTNDKHKNQRRTKLLNIYELAAGALILYPRYISPKTKKLCEVEVAFDEMLELQQKYFDVFWYRALVDAKTFALRKVRRILEAVS